MKMRISGSSKELRAAASRHIEGTQREYLTRLVKAVRTEMMRGDSAWQREKDKLMGKRNVGKTMFGFHPEWLKGQMKLLN